MRKLRKALPPLQWRVYYIIAFLVSLAIMGIVALLDGRTVIFLVGMGIFLIASLSALVFWRCPTCSRFLPIQSLLGMEHCPYCSYSLHDELEH